MAFKTTTGVPLEVTESPPLLGEYGAIIDSEKTSCAAMGSLLLEVEGELDTMTGVCPGIILPKGSDCHD